MQSVNYHVDGAIASGFIADVSYNEGKYTIRATTQPVKKDLNKKLDPKQKTIQTFNIDAQGLRKTRNENPPTREIGVTS